MRIRATAGVIDLIIRILFSMLDTSRAFPLQISTVFQGLLFASYERGRRSTRVTANLAIGFLFLLQRGK